MRHPEMGLEETLWRRATNPLPWDENYYPRSMTNLTPEIRLKAIEIANALLEEGYEEGIAIRIASAKAKEWAAQRERSR